MSTAASASPAASGQCCVCGKATRSSCSRCAVSGGLDGTGCSLFFCSPECQKLVWPAHKRVCGKSPIALPLLTPEEAAETKAYKHKPIAWLDDTGTRKSIAQAFQAVAGDTRSPENIIDCITEKHPAALAYHAANDMQNAEAPPTYDGIGSFDWNLLMPFLAGRRSCSVPR
ncbi:RHTO0S05e07338g2_1 [Rhodotorula toruloides]|uniref:RHTO0S05e07338g2_1 n=1 Tax=Rhodotorula toruloides TaxID=5286 RepID=A0A061AZG5_RHOTO|nr:RHTO0S05e07338g2_1 [Rhodotorula toruloides]